MPERDNEQLSSPKQPGVNYVKIALGVVIAGYALYEGAKLLFKARRR